ncbi:methylcrotonoyl-CoA carboxylase subunit alpha, mitochondrial [Trichogramma pretiosum]|uniref:methylcrotonoyl-CoA carboxylase subunit alpha, mitochondrial n=1 Tax=Trichogramma pretiosum TaxID=7493 RepID=UPI0006C94695|nr:methylcrotonoyl-CoA carboxylase subunit alpha, mitochondrial [Trichogramma pretiosum]
MYKLQRFLLIDNKSTSKYLRYNFSSASTNSVKEINKLLIANRGEIACRILKTAKKLGIKTVAVYSDADKKSMHVELADEAYRVGPAPSSQSYLKQDKIIEIAKKSGCHAIHPGYGFLSENANFAEFCNEQKIIFIGPPVQAIRDMGIKNKAKSIMVAAGVPVIEGYHGHDQSDSNLLKEAQKIGFPLMIKAVCGGGGKGMRISQTEEDFFQSLESARTESQKAFGDSLVLLEKYIAEPRHVEVQVFGDTYGNVVHLFERDCSVQRRHQKIIEEAPAPGISEENRKILGAAAVKAAKAVNYVGAGTVEFIMDRHSKDFYFMEMNTRLQVEHPITEAITSTDLVEWQIRVAAGETLPVKQEDINLRGHAFEARIYAENPQEGFLPCPGKIKHLAPPLCDENTRVETGVRQFDEVSVHYDPLIAKLVVWGKNRAEALNMMKIKLSEFNVVGLETNTEFIRRICSHSKFSNGEVHTGFIEENHESLFVENPIPESVVVEAALSLILSDETEGFDSSNDRLNPFRTETAFRLNHTLNRRICLEMKGKKFIVDVKYTEPEGYSIRLNESGSWRSVTGDLKKMDNILELRSFIDGKFKKSRIVKMKNDVFLFMDDSQWHFNLLQPEFLNESNSQTASSRGAAVSPMPGIVEKLFIKKGNKFQIGDPLVSIVAMKMEHIIKADTSGTIQEICCETGEKVDKNKVLVKFEDEV